MEYKKDEIKLTEDNIIAPAETELSIPIQGGVGKILFEKMTVHADKIAQIDTFTQERDTCRDLLKRSIVFATHLQALGVEKNDIVCSCVFKDKNACIPLIACLFLGAKSVYIDTVSLNYSMDGVLRQINPKVFIVIPDVLEEIEKNLKERSQTSKFIVYGESDKYPTFNSFLTPIVGDNTHESFQPVFIEDLHETALLIFSSGTSDVSKLIPINHLMICHQNFKTVVFRNLNKELFAYFTHLKAADRVSMLTFLNYNWVGATAILLHCLINGYTQLVGYRFMEDVFWQQFSDYKPITLTTSVYQMKQILRAPHRPKQAKFDFCKRITVGGEFVSEELIKKMYQVFPNSFIDQIYGNSESFGNLFEFNIFNNYHRSIVKEKPKSCGFPMNNFFYKIVDIKTEKALGYSEEGELRVKSEYIMKNYYNTTETDAYDSDGYFKTGDLAYFDEDFCFYIVDRVKTIIVYRENFLRPSYIETILSRHPAVDKCVAVGMPHEEDTEHPMALVVTTLGKFVTEQNLRAFYDTQVDDIYKLRGGIRFVNNLPLTMSDKIARKRALQMALDGKLVII